MSERLLLSMPADGDLRIHWLHWSDSTQQRLDTGSIEAGGSLDDLGERFAGVPCYVIAPGEWVSWQQVVLPKGGRVGLAALPFQLEEQLCSDLDSLHLVCGNIVANQPSDVLVVDRQRMDEWFALLKDSGLKVKSLLPDYAVLPENVVLLDERRATVRLPAAAASLSTDNLSAWWQVAGGDVSPRCYSEQGAAIAVSLPAESTQTYEQRLEQIARLFSPWPMNLLSGDYRLKEESNVLWQRLRWPVVLAGLLLALHWLSLGLEIADSRRQIALYEQGIDDIYRDTFPGARIVNARSQMRSQLAALEGGNVEQSAFMPWLDRIARASKGDSGIRLQQLNYEKNAVKVLIAADGYEQVDRWVAALLSQGFEVERGAFGQEQTGITGQLVLREGGK
ncbi:type II secretion system protein GspL [Spongiibacter tropicus]|uniref:type II secretion system protein GspL n=2 Tax=Spongiibacter TaxID=630749 RepID=UPI0023547129|nr:type II secretion system protein GspL [Spongiibacter tropicus]